MAASATHTHTNSTSQNTINTLLSKGSVCARETGETHLQEGRLLQHAEEFWEIIAHLLIHSTHQTDLPHSAGTVRPM